MSHSVLSLFVCYGGNLLNYCCFSFPSVFLFCFFILPLVRSLSLFCVVQFQHFSSDYRLALSLTWFERALLFCIAKTGFQIELG